MSGYSLMPSGSNSHTSHERATCVCAYQFSVCYASHISCMRLKRAVRHVNQNKIYTYMYVYMNGQQRK